MVVLRKALANTRATGCKTQQLSKEDFVSVSCVDCDNIWSQMKCNGQVLMLHFLAHTNYHM
jgi:hypothetical protein